MTHGANIPVRWTSPEALKGQKYTHASDVWSYGVVIWEIYTCGDTPYADMTNEQVYMEVDLGLRLPRPEKCPTDLFDLVLQMWEADVEKRPNFSKIVKEFKGKQRVSSISDESRGVFSAALGDKVEEKTGLMGLSAYHINNVVKKFMKVTKAMTTTDVLSRMKKILKNEQTSYCKCFACFWFTRFG